MEKYRRLLQPQDRRLHVRESKLVSALQTAESDKNWTANEGDSEKIQLLISSLTQSFIEFVAKSRLTSQTADYTR